MNRSKRPFRIWDPQRRMPIPYRCYATEKSAHEHVCILILWEQVGASLEIYTETGMTLLGVYTRRIKSIQIAEVKYGLD